ncbi:MAG: hypothetical protein ACK4M8_02085 [Allorhizobium sp.]
MNTRDLIRQLEQLGEQLGDMQRRLLDDLKSFADASDEYLGAIERHIERATLQNACVVAEAAWLLHEADAVRIGGVAVLSKSSAMLGGHRGGTQ